MIPASPLDASTPTPEQDAPKSVGATCRVCYGHGYTGDRYTVADMDGNGVEVDDRAQCGACEGTGYAAVEQDAPEVRGGDCDDAHALVGVPGCGPGSWCHGTCLRHGRCMYVTLAGRPDWANCDGHLSGGDVGWATETWHKGDYDHTGEIAKAAHDIEADDDTTGPGDNHREPPECPGCAGDLAGLVDAVCGGCRKALADVFAPEIPARSEVRGDVASVRDVLAEREKQRSKWGDVHDDEHVGDQLADAAAVLACSEHVDELDDIAPKWAVTESRKSFTPEGRRRELVIAAALLLAEIDRLDRLALVAGLPAVVVTS